jgi:hypothetical protein
MFWLTLILLILLGLLGIASWLKSRQPEAGNALSSLESVAGWIGLIGLVWSIVLIIQAIRLMDVMLQFAFVHWLILVITALVIYALSLILAAPVLRQLIGANGFTDGLNRMAVKFAPHRIVLGFVCLGLAAWSLINLIL